MIELTDGDVQRAARLCGYGDVLEMKAESDDAEEFAIDELAYALAQLRVAREALEKIGAECWVSVGSDKQMYARWRKLAVERVDIARAALEDLRDD